MATQGNVAKASFLQDLFQAGVYKPSQGKLVRQVSFAAIALALALGCWQLLEYMRQFGGPAQYIVPGAVLLIGGWIAYRLVNFPQFADFSRLLAPQQVLTCLRFPSVSEC